MRNTIYINTLIDIVDEENVKRWVAFPIMKESEYGFEIRDIDGKKIFIETQKEEKL